MRKIDKSKKLSTVYKKWEKSLEDNKQNHGKYTSSNHRFYQDIVMNLFFCQDGLCAYTEQRLVDNPNLYNPNNWKDGRYKESEVYEKSGQLDHFDPSLKKDKAFLWSNFLMADNTINNKKRDQEVDYILKPDSDDYDPFKLLYYDIDTGRFVANNNLSKDEMDRVEKMLKILGVNYNIANRRREILELFALRKEIKPNYKPPQFPTAFEFYLKQKS